MNIVTVDQADHKVLREPAKLVQIPISEQEKQFALDLQQKMLDLGNAVGLAATQVGKSLQIISFHITADMVNYRKNITSLVQPTILINPKYEPLIDEGSYIDWEGCFSVPGYMGEVPRYNVIHYEGYLLSGEKVSGIARGFLARVLQHEIGHLNGQLYKDLLNDNCRFGTSDEMIKVRAKDLE